MFSISPQQATVEVVLPAQTANDHRYQPHLKTTAHFILPKPELFSLQLSEFSLVVIKLAVRCDLNAFGSFTFVRNLEIFVPCINGNLLRQN